MATRCHQQPEASKREAAAQFRSQFAVPCRGTELGTDSYCRSFPSIMLKDPLSIIVLTLIINRFVVLKSDGSNFRWNGKDDVVVGSGK
jgi:hypothetical protein